MSLRLGDLTFTASDVLLKAASRIEEEGIWCQGAFQRGDQFCAVGVLTMVASELRGDPSVLSESINQFIKVHGSPVTFNDTPGRTAHEVAEAMRQAALG